MRASVTGKNWSGGHGRGASDAAAAARADGTGTAAREAAKHAAARRGKAKGFMPRNKPQTFEIETSNHALLRLSGTQEIKERRRNDPRLRHRARFAGRCWIVLGAKGNTQAAEKKGSTEPANQRNFRAALPLSISGQKLRLVT